MMEKERDRDGEQATDEDAPFHRHVVQSCGHVHGSQSSLMMWATPPGVLHARVVCAPAPHSTGMLMKIELVHPLPISTAVVTSLQG
jgi:hypothetical protein